LRLSSIIAYCSPVVQELLGLNTGEKVQELPGITPEKLATRKRRMEAYAVKLASGSFDEVLARAVLYVVCAERAVDERCTAALGTAFRELKKCARQNSFIGRGKALVRDPVLHPADGTRAGC
jgi:hypothetical protein